MRSADELVVIDAPVDPNLEISEITDRVVKAGGPALLFTNPIGSAFSVLTNQFGSERRMALALGADSLADVEARIRKAIDLSVPDTLGGKLGKLVALTSLTSAIPRTVAAGPCQEVIDHEPDLRTLPSRMLATLSLRAIAAISSDLPLKEKEEVRAVTCMPGMLASKSSSSSAKPSEKYS